MKGTILGKKNGIPIETLYVAMGPDQEGRDLILQIKLLQENIKQEKEALRLHSTHEEYTIIHFFLPLPFKVEERNLSEVSRLILLINKSLTLPGFEMSEVDRLIYFRNVLLTGDQVDELLLKTIIGNIILYVDIFSKTLEDVGNGRMTLSDVINHVLIQAQSPHVD